MQAQRLTHQELLSVLVCPATRNSLSFKDGQLVDSSESRCYELIDNIPDLRVPPERLRIDLPWYEPWDDLDNVQIRYPTRQSEKGLPYHLDGYLASMVPNDAQGRWILEIGCGERQGEAWFSERGFKYVGVDVDKRGPGPNVLADGHNLPIRDASMDYCASMAVLEHVVSPLAFVKEAHRVLKPGGVFFGSAAFVYGFHDRASFHHMSHAGLLYVLRLAGFTVEQMWPDWRYPDAISAWPFRGLPGAPWRIATRAVLASAEWTFTRLNNLVRRLAGKSPLDRMMRDISMAGSISFRATKPTNDQVGVEDEVRR